MPEPPRHNLPAEPNRFVGRERDVGDLRALFGRTRVVTLCGVGGIGKTRLALRVAAGLLPACPDGVWLVELARLGRGELVIPEIARVLRVRAEAGRPLLDTVTARLRDLCCLLLLDNCEHLVDACAEVTAGLVAACPRLSVLATSREPLRIASELIWRVPPLDLPDPDEDLAPAALARTHAPAAPAPARPLPGRKPGQAPPGKAPPGAPAVLGRTPMPGEAGESGAGGAASREGGGARGGTGSPGGQRGGEGGLGGGGVRERGLGGGGVREREGGAGGGGGWETWGAVAEVESVQLFLDRAAAAGTRLGPESLADVVRLCRALDGLPLALELAAARTSLLSPGRIADRIDDRFSLLTTGGRTAPARQRTLLAAVEWSYDLLSAKEQVLLRRLAVFAGGFDLGLAERVCAERPVAEAEIVDLLGGLVDKSLVLCDETRTRYRLLETIKRYALERLRQAGERELLRERHLGVMCELQERLFATEMVDPGVPWPERLRALTAGRSLLDDQRAALDWAVESGDVALGLRLCMVSTALLPLGGNPAEIVGWIERLLSLDVSAVPPEQIAHAKAYLAYGLEARDELSRSLEAAEESLAGLAPDNAFPRCVMHSLVVVVLLRMGRAGEALRHAEEGLAEATRTGDPWNQAAGLAGLSAVALTRGRLREAQRHGEEALARAREHGHRWIMARAAAQLGAVAEARGDLVTARARYEMAVPWLRELGTDADLARCLAHGGRVAAMLGEFAVARRRLAASLALSRETGQRQGVARCLMGLSVLAECEGDLEGALPAAAAAAELRESIGQQHATLRIEELLGRARGRLGEGRTAALWSRGRAMGPDEAARRVLEGERQPRREPPAPAEPVRRPLLTAREREIAGLLTRGLSNRAIAGELVISPATVARHIANIMEKLGYTSRAQIAVWAAEQASGSSA
ncbi:Putative HTH-type transcriptional regulator [Nonomuraea coxensis DSM 45129]|uniref:HTH-type transcriptional regulator n=1 Tax=Nonomuraea coxensis DSM 45129 TaxID=1122611 RepID=A0ABX8U9R8_9ACTN|nr:LuxR C-terminal-related transcriptional regulator [Nonomuraea coxensis]QYC44522.1 Putative HTH-type transcriptional regulator [Nonomuraea coxensis DSM 45129]